MATIPPRLAACVLLLGISLGRDATAQQSPTVESAFVRESVEALASVVDREYFDIDIAARVAASLREQASRGRYDDAQTAAALAARLTQDLFAATRDKHLSVRVVQDGVPAPASAASDEARRRTAQAINFGVRQAEILAGNVGYLNLSTFYRPEEAREAIATAMNTLSDADALIVDMRENSGGSPGTVSLLASYLLDEPALPLFDIVDRSGKRETYATESTPLRGRDGKRKVYVLTSTRTFSAGEGFAFILQERRRAEVVGERTAGAANPGRSYPVNMRFEVIVPNGQVRTAATGRNWEGVGVTPDVAAPATSALRTAHVRAIRELMAQAPDPAALAVFARALNALGR
jgi:retinol-binding protein 3